MSSLEFVCSSERVLLFLKESLPPEKRLVTKQKDKVFAPLWEQMKLSYSDPRTGSTRKVVLLTPLARALWLRFAYLIVFTSFETSFGFFNRELGNDARTAGYLLCWFGILYSMIQVGSN